MSDEISIPSSPAQGPNDPLEVMRGRVRLVLRKVMIFRVMLWTLAALTVSFGIMVHLKTVSQDAERAGCTMEKFELLSRLEFVEAQKDECNAWDGRGASSFGLPQGEAFIFDPLDHALIDANANMNDFVVVQVARNGCDARHHEIDIKTVDPNSRTLFDVRVRPRPRAGKPVCLVWYVRKR